MTNTQMLESATRPYIGKVLTGKMIVAVTLAAFPAANPASLLPSDHAGANRSGVVYADQLFSREATGYGVLATEKIIRKPRKSGTRGESLESALIAAQKLIAASEATDEATEENTNPSV